MSALTVLYKKDWKTIRNLGRLAREQSRFKALFITAFLIVLLGGLSALFLEGFKFLDALGGIGLMIVRHLFSVFFLGLGLMLIISNVITSYTTLFRSNEIPFLMLRPVPRGEIVVHKLSETALFSSWAFFFIIVPFIGAYALHEHLSPIFVALTFLFSIPFVLLCAILGTIITLVAVRWLPRFRPAVWVMAMLLLGVCLFFFKPDAGQSDDEISFILSRLTPGMKVASYPLSPSWWVSEGIMVAARGRWSRAFLFMGLLTSNVLFFGLIAERIGNAWYYAAWQKAMASTRTPRGSRPLSWRGRRIPFVAPDAGAIALKDILSLLRDPVQWTQGLLFFGLLGLYFFNLRNLQYHLLPPVWRNLIAFLNIFSLSAVMCSFCSRFVYPQLSLEGQGFWILGLSPTSMGRVLLIKFTGAVVGMLAISMFLTHISMFMLNTEWGVRLVAFLIAGAISFAFCGLATGLGAVFLDLKQRNPAAIISGFGGTLNLALSLLFMCLAILPFGALYHAYYAGHITARTLNRGLVPASAWLIIITAAATALPLAFGRKSLVSRDY